MPNATTYFTRALLMFVTAWTTTLRAEEASLHIDSTGKLARSAAKGEMDPILPAVGFNYFDPFIRLLHDPNDSTVEADFKSLASHKVPFVRFAACGFWPKEMKLYTDNREEYFRRLDRIVRLAEIHHIGLVASLFWFRPTVPDLVGEPCDSWGNPDSKTHAFMRQYVADVISRYENSLAIWGWELGNEFNLDKDLPADKSTLPPVVPQMGTPSTRSERDRLTHHGLTIAAREFAKAVRRIDGSRFLSTGNAIPRASAWHLHHERSWTADTEDQFARMLLEENPAPFVVSVHVYKDDLEKINSVGRICRQADRALFIGEFQLQPSSDRGLFQATLNSITEADAALAAVWVYNLKSQADEFSVTPTNDRSYQLESVRDANRQRRAPPTE